MIVFKSNMLLFVFYLFHLFVPFSSFLLDLNIFVISFYLYYLISCNYLFWFNNILEFFQYNLHLITHYFQVILHYFTCSISLTVQFHFPECVLLKLPCCFSEGVVPGPPTDLSVIEATQSYVVLSWKPPRQRGHEGILYFVEKVRLWEQHHYLWHFFNISLKK